MIFPWIFPELQTPPDSTSYPRFASRSPLQVVTNQVWLQKVESLHIRVTNLGTPNIHGSAWVAPLQYFISDDLGSQTSDEPERHLPLPASPISFASPHQSRRTMSKPGIRSCDRSVSGGAPMFWCTALRQLPLNSVSKVCFCQSTTCSTWIGKLVWH